MTPQEFNTHIKKLLPFPFPHHVAVAVSGGADSLALVWFLARWTRENGVMLTALTVDHGLRAGSAEEAQRVAYQMKVWQIPHVILSLNAPLLRKSQKNARQARYEALCVYCHQHTISTLFVGHHQDDQLETFFIRLKEGSHAQGLGGMLPVSTIFGIQIVRPLLSTPRFFLRKVLSVHGISWIEDPSNALPIFQRNRIRFALKTLPHKEKEFWVNALKTYHLKRVMDEEQSNAFFKGKCVVTPEGSVSFNLCALKVLSLPVKISVMRTVISCVGGARSYPLAYHSVYQLLCSLERGNAIRLTCGGCLITHRKNTVTLVREWKRIMPFVLSCGIKKPMIWDGRFYIDLSLLSQENNFVLVAYGNHHIASAEDEASCGLPLVLYEEKPYFSFKGKPISVMRWCGESTFV